MRYDTKIIQQKQVVFEQDELEILKEVFKYCKHRIKYHFDDSNWVKNIPENIKDRIIQIEDLLD